MDINRSSYYAWVKTNEHPTSTIIRRNYLINLFQTYHESFKTHGYKWLNAKIRLDTGEVLSNVFAHKICKFIGIKAETKHYGYKKGVDDCPRFFPNLLVKQLKVDRPMQVVVTDMTAFWANRTYYELTLYLDIFYMGIVTYALSSKRGDRNTYIDGLNDLIQIKKEEFPYLKLILHSDQGSVYSSKAFNELLPNYNIERSMSRAGTPTDNAIMEAINGWIKVELFEDFRIQDVDNVPSFIEQYIHYFNYERPSYSLNYETPMNFLVKWKETHKI